jgi:rubredoxin
MTGGENRRRSIFKALRKRRIDHDIYCQYYYRGTEKDPEAGYYKNLHQYSKNKIHCSCPMCSAKTKNKGNSKQKGMAPSINYKISDVRKIQKLEYEEE